MPKTMTLNDVEAMLDRIANSPSTFFRIPTKGKHLQAGGEAAMVQAFLTWARDRDKTHLKTYIVDSLDHDRQIESLSRQFFGISAILLSDEISDRSDRSITVDVRSAGLERLKILQSESPRNASRGPQYEIICADHLGEGAPRLLYDLNAEKQYELRGLSSFELVARQIVSTIVPSRLSNGLDKHLIAALGGTLYELFRNTEEHAQVDDSRLRLRRSIRGVQARLHSVDPTKLAAIVSGSPPLVPYVAKLTPPREGAMQTHFVEISVLDSGPGLAAAFTGKTYQEMSLEEEKEAVIQCFMKNATRKNRSTAGLGLPNVIDILRERSGFLRLRTGRQALYADLSNEVDRSYDELPDLLPWFGDDRRPSAALGTVMTFLLPLTRPL